MIEEEKEIEIDLDSRYKLPEFLIVNYSGRILVIFPEIAKWMVLDNNSQLDFFKLLSHQTIRDAIATSQIDQSDFEWVLVQIEGKSICATSSFEKRLDRSLHLYLTNACNLRCPHCYMNSGSRTQSELSTDEIIDIVSKFKKGKHTVKHVLHNWIKWREEARMLGKFGLLRGILRSLFVGVLVSHGREDTKV